MVFQFEGPLFNRFFGQRGGIIARFKRFNQLVGVPEYLGYPEAENLFKTAFRGVDGLIFGNEVGGVNNGSQSQQTQQNDLKPSRHIKHHFQGNYPKQKA